MATPDENLIKAALPEIQLIKKLDEGGFKAVFLIKNNGKDEALKVILIPAFTGVADADVLKKEHIARIRREVETLGKCESKEIVKLGNMPLKEITIGTENCLVYSEEFLNGENLWKLLRAGGTKPSEQELKSLFRTLLLSINELWNKHSVIHRDIKPSNVIKLNDPHRPFVLLDLGIAYIVNESGLTVNPGGRMPVATYRYLAPEMLNQNFRDTFDYRTDLYTAGLTVYEYAAQAHPLADDLDDMIRTVSRALRQPPKPLKSLRPDLSDKFCHTIDQMLKKLPALRPANLQNLIKDMEA